MACQNKECANGDQHPDELRFCEWCGGKFCGECVTEIRGIHICGPCKVCKRCGDPAIEQCEACAELLCPKHAKAYDLGVCKETGDHDSGIRCRGRCSVDIGPQAIPVMEELCHTL